VAARKEKERQSPYFWRARHVQLLRRLIDEGKETWYLSASLGRSPKAIRSKASELGLALPGPALRRRPVEQGGTKGRVKPHRRLTLTSTDVEFSALDFAERHELALKLLASLPEGWRPEGAERTDEGPGSS